DCAVARSRPPRSRRSASEEHFAVRTDSCSRDCPLDQDRGTLTNLFVTQGVDGVQKGRFPGWIEPEKYPHSGRKQESHNDRLDRDKSWPGKKVRNDHGPSAAEDYPCYPADHGEEDCFCQELQQYIVFSRPYRHPDPDLAGPFRDRNKHDIHDSDPAYDQRYGGYCAEKQRHRL